MSIGSLLFCVSMRTSVAVSISSFIMPASKGSPFPGSPSISLSTSAMQIWLPSYAQIIFLRRREGSLNQLRASHFPFASFSIGLLIGLSVPATKYKPRNPSTTKTAPATRTRETPDHYRSVASRAFFSPQWNLPMMFRMSQDV